MSFIKYIITVLVFTILPLAMSAQTVWRGSVNDETGKPLGSVVIKAQNRHGKLIKYTQSNRNGEFQLSENGCDSIYTVTFSRLSFATETIERKDFEKLKKIIMHDAAISIKEVVVKSVPIHQMRDTLVYDVNSFKKGNDRTIEDVIKRLPGIHVDNAGGIYYQGERISKFYIENMDMLSGNYTLATKNISADDISSVSVYENHQPVRALKDVSFSDKAALNLKIKNGRKLKPIGYLQQGLGCEEKNVLWKSDAFGMEINKKSQCLLNLKANDTGETFNTMQELGGNQISDFSSFTWDGISLSAQDLPAVSLDRYLENKSGIGSFNSLFQLKDKQTLTLNLHYSGDEIHYQNQKKSSIFVGDNLYQDFSEKIQAAVFANNLRSKIKLENNTDKVYFLENLSFNARFFHKNFNVEDNFNGSQKQKTNNFQLVNQLSSIYHLGGKIIQFQSNIRFSNTPVNRLETFPISAKRQMYQSLCETVFQTDEHTSFGLQLGSLFQMGVRIDFESNYNKISLARIRSGNDAENTFKGYKLNTSLEPYWQMSVSQFTWEIKAPMSLLNVHFDNLGENKEYRLDKVYANINTSVAWNMLKGLKVRLSGGTQCRFGDISNYVTTPIFYTYKDATTLGTGLLTNRNVLFVNGHVDFHNTVRGLFASLMGSISHTHANSMAQTRVSNGSIYQAKSDKRNSLLDKMLTLNLSKNIHSTGTSLALLGNWGISNTHIMSKDMVLGLANKRYIVTVKLEQSLWNDKLNLALDYSYYQNKNCVQELTTKMYNHQGSWGVSYFILKSLELFGDVSYNWLKEIDYRKQMIYANAGLRYKKKNIEVELLIRNLTNQNYYVINKQIGESNYRYRYNLRPISCMLSFKYNY